MKLHKPTTAGRTAFTLIELLVVIAIIAVLIGLSISAVMQFYQKGPELQARNDISGLTAGVREFETVHNVDYIPSRIVLREELTGANGYQTSVALENDSLTYLKRAFGRTIGDNVPQGYIDWNGNGVRDIAPVTLEGQQCLVFFVGGIPHPTDPAVTGFSASPRDPSRGVERRGPFFNFQSRRLVRGPNGFFTYNDPYGKPYAYFSNYGRANGYNRYGSSDCASLGVAPYRSSGTTFVHPDTYQIISGGKDGLFGPGNTIWPGNLPTQGQDDMSNFHSRKLGSQ